MSSVKVKVRELSGKALNWAVAKCEDGGPHRNVDCKACNCRGRVSGYGYADMGEKDCEGCKEEVSMPYPNSHDTPYSTDWNLGGPILVKEDISFRKYHNPRSEEHGTYYAKVCRESGSMIRWSKETDSTGPTSLIAGMRCYVVSKLGVEIEIPEELL